MCFTPARHTWSSLALFSLTCAALAKPTGHSSGPAPQRPDTARAVAEIQQVVNRWQQAGNRGDVPGFMSIYTPDYVAVGRMHYQLSRAALSQMMVITIQKTKYRIVAQISQLRVQANRAEALMMKHETMTWPDPKDGKMLRGARHELCRDTWIRTKAGWKIQHSQILSSHLDKVLPVAAKATRH